jgi:hypothetical protein
VFLATPFCGSDATTFANWEIVVCGIMGEDTSNELINDLNSRDTHVRQRVQMFAETANADSVRLPLHCFYETKKTKILRKLFKCHSLKCLPIFGTGMIVCCFCLVCMIVVDHGQLVKDTSACLVGFPRTGLVANHSLMNKFDSPENENFKLVKPVIRKFADDASTVLSRRKQCKLEGCFIVQESDRSNKFKPCKNITGLSPLDAIKTLSDVSRF